VVVLTRDRAIPVLANVVVAAITRTVRGLPTEVELGPEHGVDAGCVINCDNLLTIAKRGLGRRRGELDPAALIQLRAALLVALDLR
jgi:mRNA interferase MazF